MHPDAVRLIGVYTIGLIIANLVHGASQECPGCGNQPMGLHAYGVCYECAKWLADHPEDWAKVYR